MSLKGSLLALAAVSVLVIPPAVAHEGGHSVVVEVEGPALPAPPAAEAPSVYSAPVHASAPVPAAVECCPIQVLREVATLSAKRAYRCHGAPIHQVLCVDNPADCRSKLYSVPVCVPACCVGEPVCCGSTVGLLGRGHVTYRWPCGFEALITFRVHGGVLITYR